jgi:fructosamine-3-kinase
MRPAAAPELAGALRAAFPDAAPVPAAAASGTSAGPAWRWSLAPGLEAFVKTAPAADAGRLDAEADGLAALAGAEAVRVPRVLAAGTAGGLAWLAVEWLALVAPTPASEARLGEALAGLHRVRAARFGWHRDNFIGATPQANAETDDWVTFLRERRLRPQLGLVRANGHGRLADLGERLLESLPVFYASYRPAASLLHGDLWGGNHGALAGGEPVVFDPATYHGDREADLAMTRLFGGFGPRFYAAYQASWPLDAAAGYRRDLHNLYHVLNHANLFGGGYAAQAESMIGSLLAEAGR